jgi:hypothetical protein
MTQEFKAAPPDGEIAMKTTQGWGWLAAGVLALGLNGFYHDGGLDLAHRAINRISDRSAMVVALASERADDLLDRVELVSERQTQSCRLTTGVARFQNQIARAQTKIAGTQAGFDRFEAVSARQGARMVQLEANGARIEAQAAQFRFAAFAPVAVRVSRISTPRISIVSPRLRVVVPPPDINISVPCVHVSTSGTGPI